MFYAFNLVIKKEPIYKKKVKQGKNIGLIGLTPPDLLSLKLAHFTATNLF